MVKLFPLHSGCGQEDREPRWEIPVPGTDGGWSPLSSTRHLLPGLKLCRFGVCFNRKSSLFSLAQVCILKELQDGHLRIFFCRQGSRHNLVDEHLLSAKLSTKNSSTKNLASSVPTHISYKLSQGQSLLLLDKQNSPDWAPKGIAPAA